jgi:hypothetical protein
MVRRGTTIIEMLLVVGLTAMVLGTLALLYAFTFGRVAHATASFAATDQARRSLDQIAKTASQAISCSVVTSGSVSALKCMMPASGTDTDGDGYLDEYVPSSVSRRGVAKYTPGKRIWFYLSNSDGAFGSSGTILWRAQRSDDCNPASSDADKNWAYYYGSTQQRFGLITSLTPAVDTTAKTTTVTAYATSLIRSDSEAGAEAGSRGTYGVSYTRTVLWRSSTP